MTLFLIGLVVCSLTGMLVPLALRIFTAPHGAKGHRRQRGLTFG